ncbi:MULTISPECIES: LacI family DNA-binding transcriptional regulator [Cytobacillus]|uniref:Sucrose operon repressor ScrR, LacI family n=2 Tax=Cytobacillus TaxID=2675230 RepID=A0A380XRV9_CYTFI|nr:MULTISPECIES: LacI family DNA-binding transcriptional regulator [Cytobacillus]AND40589.1 LacI family transcriptional regulator [Cytobacillus oceanisediminis 2691]KAF0822135.1 Sucrose operon repressor ScrR, LacI family [Cytobacillus firmus]MBG9543204.1 LacI family transcriptional regulator [Cytobacillus firmus]MBG9552507.1 LacI family transcriptional regulator [Cytobacillus firmus]MBG9558832.1 LacI family transcriptional regulator [Cytobacillus firmus]
MNTTIKDIAKLAGVAKSTVSRYLNGGHVSEQTKAKIRKVVEETKYEPNSFAQSLKAKKTNFIGVIAPTLDSYVTSTVLMAIDEELRKRDYTTLIISTSKHVDREIESLISLSRQKVDGIILIATGVTEKHIETINSIQIPVLIVAQEVGHVTCIINDDYQAGFKMGQYVAQKGHRAVAYIGVAESDIAVGQRRKQGIMEGLKSAGVSDVKTFVSQFDLQDAARVTQEVLEESSLTAIICATDTIAFGAMKTITKLGKKVPKDFSIAGFGGYNISGVIHPALTTIRFKNEETGVMAAETIIKLTNGEEVPNLQVSGFDFIEGESVKSVKS